MTTKERDRIHNVLTSNLQEIVVNGISIRFIPEINISKVWMEICDVKSSRVKKILPTPLDFIDKWCVRCIDGSKFPHLKPCNTCFEKGDKAINFKRKKK